MKLNMQMIANRLTGYDIETEFSSGSERTIISALPFSAPGSVYVHQVGNDVECLADQGRILIRNISSKECFLLIQSIFNWYDDWLLKIEKSLEERNYRRFARLCAMAFNNPVMFQDNNYMLLGMNLCGVDLRSLPAWKYALENDQVSIDYYTMMASALKKTVAKYGHNIHRFSTVYIGDKGERYPMSGLHAKVSYQSRDFGKLTVLENNRPLNNGDVALIKILSELAALKFAASYSIQKQEIQTSFFIDLLESRPVSAKQLEYYDAIITEGGNRQDGRLYIFCIRFADRKDDSKAIQLLRNILRDKFPSIQNWLYNGELVAITYTPKPVFQAQQFITTLNDIGYAAQLQIGISLPFRDIRDIPYYYDQAVFAANCATGPGVWNFYQCARLYLLQETERERRIRACEPMCRELWAQSPGKREYLQTLAVYLEHERAAGRAAELLFIHKNTLNYRVKYLKELTGWDYDAPAIRDYLRLSIYFLSESDK